MAPANGTGILAVEAAPGQRLQLASDGGSLCKTYITRAAGIGSGAGVVRAGPGDTARGGVRARGWRTRHRGPLSQDAAT